MVGGLELKANIFGLMIRVEDSTEPKTKNSTVIDNFIGLQYKIMDFIVEDSTQLFGPIVEIAIWATVHHTWQFF